MILSTRSAWSCVSSDEDEKPKDRFSTSGAYRRVPSLSSRYGRVEMLAETVPSRTVSASEYSAFWYPFSGSGTAISLVSAISALLISAIV